MPNRYPYISSSGPLTQAVTQLRKSFPAVVDADLLKKLGLASNNESYLIGIIRFLGLIEKDGKKISEKAKIFLAGDEPFQDGLAELIHEAYKELFEIRGEDAWSADRQTLTTFFRQSDESSELVGQRQANTFSALATLAGKRAQISTSSRTERPAQNVRRPTKSKATRSKASPPQLENTDIGSSGQSPGATNSAGSMALTVRVEINLPAQADQETYDRIFRSLRANLIDAR